MAEARKSRGSPGPPGPRAVASRYLARGRPGFLAVAEGGRALTVMVGPLRGPAHLELVHRARFYHVPASAIAASRTAVTYSPFTRGPDVLGGRTGVIREYAAVLRVSRVRRSDLPGLAWPARGAPDAPYYRFDLGPIQTLPRPITNPDRLRVAFRFPEWRRFHEAATLRELGGRAARRKAGAGKKAAETVEGGREET